MEKKLNEFSVGERGVVVRIEGEGQIYRRLLDMGITPGAEISLPPRAPAHGNSLLQGSLP